MAVATGGCGSSAHTPAQSTSIAATSANPSGPGALQAEANSAAAGDIPDNQEFLVFRNDRAGYSMKYPEGWAQRGSNRSVVFRDKNNIVRIVVTTGPAPSNASVARELRHQKGVRVIAAPRAISGSGKPLLKGVYSTESAPNSVTGKRVTLVVDRYYLRNGGRRAIVDLGTPQGVDNVDAYRIFEPGVRGHAQRGGGNEGAGLGLSLARRLARSVDGDIVADATAPVGRFPRPAPDRLMAACVVQVRVRLQA